MNIIDKRNESNIKPNRRWGLGFLAYFIAGITYYIGNKFYTETQTDKLIVSIIAIVGGIIYWRIIRKRTKKITENNLDKGFVFEDFLDAIIVILVSGFVIGFLTKAF